jgi:hypothetical protein
MSPTLEAIPPSSLPRIPQSVVREAAAQNNPLFSAVQETPTRALPRTRDFLGIDRALQPRVLPPSSSHIRRSSAQLFSTVSDSGIKLAQDARTQLDVLETPIKKKPINDLAHGHPIESPRFDQENKTILEAPNSVSETPKKVNMEQEGCIYKSLGWEDDDIDDLG